MCLKLIDGNYRVMEIAESQIRQDDNLNFKLVYKVIKP